MSIPLFFVDAFTPRPFAGNPAAVCLLETAVDDARMQNIAHELNFSETAFLLPLPEGYRLRWFTPVTEVDLCGHATLAAAHVLWESGRLNHSDAAVFQTRSGELRANYRAGLIWLDFPQAPIEACALDPALQTALGLEPLFVGRFGPKLLIEVADEKTVRELHPDFPTLLQLPGRGIAVTSRSETPGIDFVSRYFAPWVGVNEDPVTGSAHCALAPFWAQRLGKTQLQARQISTRGGDLRIELQDDRCLLGGHAVTTLQGSWLA